MPSLSPRENYLRALRHEETEYVPSIFITGYSDIDTVGLFAPTEWGQQSTNFLDSFGVRWTTSESVNGGMIPVPGEFLLKDVTRWKKDVAIADVDKFDWKQIAEQEYAALHVDPDKKVVSYINPCGIWERLAALMGFEEAMIALMEEPEACNEFFTRITDFKIKVAEKARKYYRADVFVNFDDIATERQLFMSPATYRALIKPHHKRLNDAVRNLGMIPIQHTCGHAELCVEDYIETGAESWNSVQPSNDLAAILDKHGDKFCLEGGYDTTGKPGRPDATPEVIRAEVERCFREYGSKKGYVFLGIVLATANSKVVSEQTVALGEAADRCRFAGK